MGIQGLLPLLKSIMVPIHIKDLDGCCVAVDTYSWLHKGALSCSTDLCKALPTSRHIDYCMHRVNLLRHYGIRPLLVFDGGLLPMKSEQENKRARMRKENLARAIEHESHGNATAAYECYQKAVDISPLIALQLIQVLKKENVCYVVAPYEADAQMTFLAVSKQVDAVITEDSDLIPFGCPRIIFKMDKFGQGVEFRSSMLQQNKELSFEGFTKKMLLEMCILSGCDYLQSLPGMGIKRAHALVKKFKSYDKVLKHFRYNNVSVPPLYEESFKKAILTFQHQRVYDLTTEDIVHLSDVPDGIGDDLDYLGPIMPKHIAKGLAKGDLCPFTKMPFQVENVCVNPMPKSSQFENFKPASERRKVDLPAQKNVLTKYFCFASLEATRNFRAPRLSPKNPSSMKNSTIRAKEYRLIEASANEINSSPIFLLDSENVDDGTPPNNSADGGYPSEISNFSGSLSEGIVNAGSPKDTLLQQSKHSIHQPCLVSHKERHCKDVTDAVEVKTRTENRKVIVSSYFKQKSVNDNDRNDKQEKFEGKDDFAIDTCENSIPENVSFKNYHFKATSMKRKKSHNDSLHMENLKTKLVVTDKSLSNKGSCIPNPESSFAETETEERKFGSNISHLGHYSDIAEKSMERFVSIVSSFSYSSTGSRASGLRAPLKDIRNTCTRR